MQMPCASGHPMSWFNACMLGISRVGVFVNGISYIRTPLINVYFSPSTYISVVYRVKSLHYKWMLGIRHCVLVSVHQIVVRGTVRELWCVWWPVTCVLKEGCKCINYLATHPWLCHLCVEGRLWVYKPLNYSHTDQCWDINYYTDCVASELCCWLGGSTLLAIQLFWGFLSPFLIALCNQSGDFSIGSAVSHDSW